MTPNHNSKIMVEYKIVRSGRKTMALYVRGCSVEVRAPYTVSDAEIHDFVVSKQQWLAKHLAIHSQREAQRSTFSLDYGSLICYRDQLYEIKARPGNMVSFSDAFYVPDGLNSEEIIYACVQLYRLLAKECIVPRTRGLARAMDLKIGAVRIGNAKRRWGSCSASGNINFSWRLIMAPDDVIDYVILHELAHTIELNHSHRFWAIIAEVMPDYEQRKLKLHKLSEKLANEDWP
jgi:predicted metal-dependent hydrolase